jgi:hypothetical protein
MTSSFLHERFGRWTGQFGTCDSLEKPKEANVLIQEAAFSLKGANVTLERE